MIKITQRTFQSVKYRMKFKTTNQTDSFQNRWALFSTRSQTVMSGSPNNTASLTPAHQSMSTLVSHKPQQSVINNNNLHGNKIMFQSLGCPRNWVDTEVMLGIVLQAGFEPTQDSLNADYLVVNTCGFLKSAREESKSEIEQLISSKKKGSKLIVTGCMVNLHKAEILESYPAVDHVLGSGSVDKILNAIRDNRREEDATLPSPKSFLENGEVPRLIATPKHYAYLKIAEGCRKRCSFCIIPKIKGRLQSKPEEQIITECHSLLQNGATEIILIAQDLGDYGKDRREHNGLASLLKNILGSTEQDFWLRLMYLYPDEITEEVISIIQNDTRVVRYLDMPIQHINDDILKKMKRTTCAADIRNTIQTLRERLPGMHIRTSLMVGFPGETEDQFEELLNFVKTAKLEHVGVFQYSDEELAWSSRLPDHVSEDVKQDRFNRLMQAQLEVVVERNQDRVKSKMRLDVVLEGYHPEDKQMLVGRYYGQCPDVDSQVIINDFSGGKEFPQPGKRYEVEVTDFFQYDLVARMV